MKRDLAEVLVGIGVLALGLAVLLFTFSQALALVQSPGTFLESQLPQADPVVGPTASFSWVSDNLTATFTDESAAGDAPITSREWDFGDGQRSNEANPQHTYGAEGAYEVRLVVRDAAGRQHAALGQANLIVGETRSGGSVQDPFAGVTLDFNISGVLLPVALALLTVGLYLVLAVIGGMITKAGWNLVKPKPETVRVRLKPDHLRRAFEEDRIAATSAESAPLGFPPP